MDNLLKKGAGHPLGQARHLKNSWLSRTLARTSITWKIRIGMLIISISILISFMAVSITYTYKNMMSSSIEAARKNLVFSQNNLDNMLNMVENYSILLLSDEKIQDILSSRNAPKDSVLSQNQIMMRNRINAIVGSFETISAVLIYDIYGNIYDSGITLLNEESAQENLPEDLPVWIPTEDAPYYIAVPGKTIRPSVVSFTRHIFDYQTGRRIGTVRICIDESYISRTYSDSIVDGESMYMISRDNILISNPDSSLLYTKCTLPTEQFTSDRNYISVDKNYIMYEDYDRLDAWLISSLPKHIIQDRLNSMIRYMLMIGSCLILLCIAISSLISRNLTHNLSNLTSAMKTVWNGNWKVKVENHSQDEVGVLTHTFNKMLAEIEKKTDSLVQEQKVKREFQLELLNQQINPHFLYNTLDNICALAELNRIEELSEMVNNLTDFYRGVLSKGSIVISLERELHIAENYLKIMQIRYYHSFSYTLEAPASVMENTALRLTLQPLLENAVYHGFETHEPGGMIRIRIRPFSSFLIVSVCDNGAGMDRHTLSSLFGESPPGSIKKGFGLRNVHERIQLYYGKSYGMKAYSRYGCGTQILIKIPRCNWRDKTYAENTHS